MSANNLIISIEGPTASGKTALAVALAQHLETEIVSSDSRQCYKEMNIGTAVPTLDERKGIVHHMIHSHSVTDKLTAASFATCAQWHIEAVLQERDSVVLVGGSPLYAEAILYGLNELPEIDEDIVSDTRALSLEALQELIKTNDPQTYSTIDLMNRRRLERAAQVYLQTGEKLSELLNRPKKTPSYRCLRLRIDLPRERLYQRINQRVEEMYSAGLVEEAKAIWPNSSEIINATIGYYELFGAFEQRYALGHAKALIQQHSRNFAKRQLTWYRKAKTFVVLSESNAKQEALNAIRGLLPGENPLRVY